MKQPQPASVGVPEIEFSVYVYYYPEDIEDKHTDWEKMAVTGDLADATDKAETLYNSREFKKVEIKKKYYDARYQRVMDKTHKVFQENKRMSRRSGIMALFGFSCFAGLMVVALPFIGTF